MAAPSRVSSHMWRTLSRRPLRRPSTALKLLSRRDVISCRYFSDEVSARDLKFGQPLHETHPHLLGPGELTRGITALEYAQRRERLASKLKPGSAAVFFGNGLKYRSGPIFWDFHQDTDFFYLTGLNEPEAVAVIERPSKGSEHIFHIFIRPKSTQVEEWAGARSGVQAAEDVFNADEAHEIGKLPDVLRQICSTKSVLVSDDEPPAWLRKQLKESNSSASSDKLAKYLSDNSAGSTRSIVSHLRAVKSAAEIRNMRKVGQISGRVMTEAIRRPHSLESSLAAQLDFGFRTSGCEHEAYVPVVAAGSNALCIHYTRNDDTIAPDQLVCVDAGGQLGYYVADITRTWPNSGRFSDAQRDLYNVVLAAQRTCISLCRADAQLSLAQIDQVAERELRRGLETLGFDFGGKGPPIRRLFRHHVGHHVGLDVHDVPHVSKSDKLVTGNCVAIEPGLYIPESPDYPRAFHGMGIRVEDCVAIEDTTPHILTTEAVKEIDDIEALRS